MLQYLYFDREEAKRLEYCNYVLSEKYFIDKIGDYNTRVKSILNTINIYLYNVYFVVNRIVRSFKECSHLINSLLLPFKDRPNGIEIHHKFHSLFAIPFN